MSQEEVHDIHVHKFGESPTGGEDHLYELNHTTKTVKQLVKHKDNHAIAGKHESWQDCGNVYHGIVAFLKGKGITHDVNGHKDDVLGVQEASEAPKKVTKAPA